MIFVQGPTEVANLHSMMEQRVQVAVNLNFHESESLHKLILHEFIKI